MTPIDVRRQHLVHMLACIRVGPRGGLLVWILALAAYAPMQRAEAATATCGTSTMNMYKSDDTAMPTSMTFEPREKQQSGSPTFFSGKMVWNVTKCNSATHTFTSKLNGSFLTGNTGLTFTASTPTVDSKCPLTATLNTVVSGTKSGRGTFDCTMTFPFTLDTTSLMTGTNMKKTPIATGTVFGATVTTASGTVAGSLDVKSDKEYVLVPKSPCSTISTPASVNLGTYSTLTLTNPGYSQWVPFQIQLNTCFDLTNAKFTFTYDDTNSLDLITNKGSAGGVAVELYNLGASETVIKNNVAFVPLIAFDATNGTFSLQARMKKAPGGVPQPGSVQASATLTVTYP